MSTLRREDAEESLVAEMNMRKVGWSALNADDAGAGNEGHLQAAFGPHDPP